MQKLYSNILETIGSTPIVRVNPMGATEESDQKNQNSNLWVKLEYFNPAGSIKDRPAYNMIMSAIKRGEIDKNSVIIEPTSGNMGIGLALVSAVLGIKFVAVMPENMSDERKKIIRAYGAEIVLTSADLGMKGSVDKAFELKEKYGKNTYIPMQFENPDNPISHYEVTAEEIFNQTDGKVDIVVAGVGTSGTLIGLAKKLKELKPNIKVIGIEAKESPLLTKGVSGAHKIQGISANFVPKIYDKNFVDEIIDIASDDAIKSARYYASHEGILTGYSGGAILASFEELKNKYIDKMIVGILADNGERYLSGELYE